MHGVNDMKIVWLASYPKSGNTWLRFFLHNYLFGKATSSQEVAQKIPDIHRIRTIPSDHPGSLLCKTHFALSPHHPSLQDTIGFIYLLRHPKDILLSSLNYCRLEGDNLMSEEEFAMEFIKNMGAPKWEAVGMGSWPSHYHSWMHKPSFPHIVLRYENMLESPQSCFQQVLEFLNIPVDKCKLDHAVHECSFQKLKDLEAQEKGQGQFGVVFPGTRGASESGLRFFHQGKSGQTLDHIGSHIEEQFNEQFGSILQELGYT